MSNKRRNYEPEMPKLLRDEIYGNGSGNRQRPQNTNRGGVKKSGIKNKKRPSSSNTSRPKNVQIEGNKRPSSSNTSRPKNVQNKGNKRPIGTKPNTKSSVSNDRIKRNTSVQRQAKRQADKRMDGDYKRATSAYGKRPTNPPKKKRKKIRLKRIVFGTIILIVQSISQILNFIKTGGDHKQYLPEGKQKKLNIKFSRIFSIASMGIIVFMMLCVLTIRPMKKSIEENRDLAQKPSFSISDYINGKYSKAYATYISDQFPFRTSLVKNKAKMDLLLGKKEINGVYICKDGYLMEGFKNEPEKEMKKKAEAIALLTKKNPGINLSVMLVPNKCEILKNLLPKNAPVDSETKYLDEFKDMLPSNVNFVNLVKNFETNKASTELYFKTDHHWTADGAYKAYTEYMHSLHMEPSPETSFKRGLATNNFLGSLYYKNGGGIGAPESMYLYLKNDVYPLIVKYFDGYGTHTTLYDSEKINGRDPYEVFTSGNHSQIKIRTAVETDRKLLIFKDSYANAMLPFLINNFAEITVVDLRYYHDKIQDLFSNNEITDILVLYNVNTFSTDPSILNLEELNKESKNDGKLKNIKPAKKQDKKKTDDKNSSDKNKDNKKTEDKDSSDKKQ